MRRLLLWLALLCGALGANAQMWTGQDTLYGPEWIRYNATYWRIPIAADGWYRVSRADLEAWGWTPTQQTPGGAWRLYHNGQEIPLYLTQEANWGPGDYAAFWGQRNRGELDAYLFKSPAAQQLNTEYSLVSDTAAYYLAWISDAFDPPRRYAALPNDLGNPPPAMPYLWRESRLVFNERFLKEYLRTSDLTIYFSQYGIGEGYGTRNVDQMLQDGAAPQSLVLPVSAPYAAGPAPQLTVRYACAAGPHQQQLRAEGELVHESTFNGWKVEQPVVVLPVSVNWADGLTVESRGIADSRDEASLALAALRYPALPDAEGQSALRFRLEASTVPLLLEIANFPEAAGPPNFYDLSTGRRIAAVREGGQVRALIPPTAVATEWLLTGEAQGWLPSPAAAPRIMAPLVTSPADFLIITHSRLRQGATDWVGAYADYRRSSAGGGYRVAVVDIADLYDQFAYGLERHPLAIRNFIHWLRRQHNGALRYVFLMGKGRDYNQVRTAAQLSAAEEINFFLPSFGFPASDNLLAAGNHYDAPTVALGRLPAIEAEEVRLYLAKVQALESQATAEQTVVGRAWMKQILHLGGGGSAGEQQSIRNNLEQMSDVLASSIFGTSTTSFYKTSTDPIQDSQTERLFDRINEGVSIITFFGHSSSGGFDFSIDVPDNYANAGKYPLMLSLGCYSGDMFVSFRSIGERFIFLPDKGAVAFGATKGFGYIHALYNFGRNFYQQMGGARYGQGIGDGLKATYADFEGYADMPHRILRQQFALNGDPALRLNPAPGPDYLIAPGSVRFTPNVASVQSDSFEVSFELMNLGRHLSDTVTVQIDQQLPNGQIIALGSWRGAAPPYAKPISLRLPTRGRASVGLNTLFFTVDPADEREELPAPSAELNNDYTRPGGQRGAPLYVVDNVALPVWPTRYALVGEAPVTLKASTADALAPVQTYQVEIDTDPRFRQPLARTAITQGGGVISWTPPLNWLDSTVYYWRISPDSLPGSPGYTWETSSFTYVAGSAAGWSQGHWGQWGENQLTNIQVNREGNLLQFTDNTLDIRIRNKVYDANDPPYYYNGGQFISSPWTWSINEGLNVVVLPYPTLDYWRNPYGGLYGSINTAGGWASVLPFAYRTNTQLDRANLIDFLENIIPDSSYIIIYSAQRNLASSYRPDEWAADSASLSGKNIFNVLEAQGAIRLRETASLGSRPYLLFYQKNVGLIGEALADSIKGDVTLEHSFRGLWYSGEMLTVPVGPARQWHKAELRFSENNLSSSDSLSLSIIGIKTDGSKQVLLTGVDILGNWETGLSQIDASEYPRLELKITVNDFVNRTIPKIAYLQVYYQGLHELAINNSRYYEKRDSVSQGEKFSLVYAIENIGAYPVDSFSVVYMISGQGEPQVKKISYLASNEFIFDTLLINTAQQSGKVEYLINLNPENIPVEVTRLNNAMSSSYYVYPDVVSPVLDVKFDGKTILNGDIISPQPKIDIRLIDENPHLLLTDPDLIELSIIRPGVSASEAISADKYNWIPASDNNNYATIDWQPIFDQNGEYKLIVQGKDVAGNRAGRIKYEVLFTVIKEQTISHFVNYPNPFSTQTSFVYTLTGKEPSDLRIQIMTVSGRVVREITKDELGLLSIGTHKTDFQWDGTDQYGDRLANGVYLYRVIAKDDLGNPIEVRDNGTSSYFNNGIGKIVILR